MKNDTRKTQGFQVNVEVPEKPLEVLHIDFADVCGKTVMVVVDRFSKYAWFVPLGQTDAVSVAHSFFTCVVSHHGLPKVIISDRDARFTGKFWKTLMSLFNTELLFSTAFHPQSDGMAEVTVRTLKQLLACCAEETDWQSYLPQIQMMYNSSPQSRTGRSPYEILHGRQMTFPADLDFTGLDVPAVESFAVNLEGIWADVRQRLREV